MTCPHGGTVQIVPAGPAPLVLGLPVTTAADQLLVGGCAAQPTPCVKVQWQNMSTSTVGGKAVLLQSTPSGPGDGTCLGSATPGPPQVISMQSTVTAL